MTQRANNSEPFMFRARGGPATSSMACEVFHELPRHDPRPAVLPAGSDELSSIRLTAPPPSATLIRCD